MARIARVEVFTPDEIAIVHVMNRTVRRCQLLGVDELTGRNFDHRKVWMESELRLLAANFGIDLLCYAIMSNHFHLVLRSRPDVVMQWDDTEVARRWLLLCPKRKRIARESGGITVLEPPEPTECELNAIRNNPPQVLEIRRRLSDISWWMRLLSQRTAQRANREVNDEGKFWQPRFRAVRLLDEAAILACAAYVDLNPIRAALAETLETSNFTSARLRVLDLQTEVLGQGDSLSSSDLHANGESTVAGAASAGRRSRFLAPLTIDELRDELGAHVHTGGDRASDKGFLQMTVAGYAQLLDWTARQLRSDKIGATPSDAAPIFARLGISAEAWLELVRDFKQLFSNVAGKPHVIDSYRSRRRAQKYKTRSRVRELLPS